MSKCWWELKGDLWKSGCELVFPVWHSFDAGPIDGGHSVCPYCGQPLVEVRPEQTRSVSESVIDRSNS
jgi:hypothetical protein